MHANTSLFRMLSKSQIIGFVLIIINALPLSAKPVCISAQVVQTTLASGRIASGVSLIGGAYFLLLLGIGYAVNRYYIFRKNKNEENAEWSIPVNSSKTE